MANKEIASDKILQDIPCHFPVEGTRSKVPGCDKGAKFHLCIFELFPQITTCVVNDVKANKTNLISP